MDAPASAGSKRGVGIAMIAGGVAVLALVLLFSPEITRWFEFVTAAVLFLVALVLVIRGVVIAIREDDKRG
jgi:high-affinity Fe2+/Pb2+ permease